MVCKQAFSTRFFFFGNQKTSCGKCYLGLVETHIFVAEDQENYIAPIQSGLVQWRESKEEVIGVSLVPKYSFGQVGQGR